VKFGRIESGSHILLEELHIDNQTIVLTMASG